MAGQMTILVKFYSLLNPFDDIKAILLVKWESEREKVTNLTLFFLQFSLT